MYVRHLAVGDFRSWASADVAFEPGPSVLVGANGQGKTNLVEALGYLAGLTSHRVPTDAPLIRAGAPAAVVRAAVVAGGRELRVEVEIVAGRANRARLNGSPLPRARDILGVLRTVLFAPEDLAIVRGDPSERRRFLDELVVARSPRLAAVRSDYERVLKQRATLLKSAGAGRRGGASADLRTLDIWDGHLAESGAELLAARLATVRALRPHAAATYAAVASGTQASTVLGLRYVTSLAGVLPQLGPSGEVVGGDVAGGDVAGGDVAAGPAVGGGEMVGGGIAAGRALPADPELPGVPVLVEALLAELARVRSQELERGVNLVGPHRDDLELTLGPMPVRGYASHGESWSTALALRVGSFELLRDEAGSGGDPVLILDDVFAELDGDRRAQLALTATKAEQSLITAAVGSDVPEELHAAWYEVQGGSVRRVR